MSLAVAIQMDPVSTIDIKGDSTFVLALEAQRRGHGLFAQHGRVVRSVGGLRRGSSKTDSTVIVLSVIPEDSFSGSLVLLHLYIGLLS